MRTKAIWFVAGFLLAVFLGMPLAGGTIVVTQGVSKATYDFCTSLVAAKVNKTTVGPSDLAADLTPSFASVDWTQAALVVADCTVNADCAAECLASGCANASKGSSVSSSSIELDGAGASYCACTCADGDKVYISSCT